MDKKSVLKHLKENPYLRIKYYKLLLKHIVCF